MITIGPATKSWPGSFYGARSGREGDLFTPWTRDAMGTLDRAGYRVILSICQLFRALLINV